MKRFICIILVVLCTFCLFARDKHVTSTEEGRLAEDLLEDGLYKNRDEILSLAPVLTPQEITLLYNKAKVSSVKDALENGLLGFGIGSFSSGDRKGGWIQLGCELGGVIVGGGSLIYLVGGMLVEVLTLGTDDSAGTVMLASAAGIVIGGAAFIGGRIYGIVRGIKYPKQYNKDLQETLYGTSGTEPQITLAPVFSPSGIGFGVGVRF